LNVDACLQGIGKDPIETPSEKCLLNCIAGVRDSTTWTWRKRNGWGWRWRACPRNPREQTDAKSSLGDAKSSLGDVKSSLGDAKSSLGDVWQVLSRVRSGARRCSAAHALAPDASIVHSHQRRKLFPQWPRWVRDPRQGASLAHRRDRGERATRSGASGLCFGRRGDERWRNKANRHLYSARARHFVPIVRRGGVRAAWVDTAVELAGGE
jgi:hypothetical protein